MISALFALSLHSGAAAPPAARELSPDLSRGVLKGRYRIVQKVTYRLPKNEIEIEDVRIENEINGTTTYTHLSYSESSPWISIAVDVLEIDEDGRPLRTLSHQTCETGSTSTALPEDVPGFARPVVTLFKNCELSAQKVVDRGSGRALLFSYRGRAMVQIEVEKAGERTLRARALYAPKADVVGARADVIEEGVRDGLHLRLDSLVPEGEAVPTRLCARAGESRPLPALLLADGTRVSRQVTCRAAPSDPRGFERVVTLTDNPAHDPRTAEITKQALGRTGRAAKMPLYAVAVRSRVNCHGYALRATMPKARLELPDDALWFEGGRNDEGDLITLIDGGQYSHTGVIVRPAGRKDFLVQSKLAEGPVVETPLANLVDTFGASAAEVYRLKK